jgi:hypothetical protein
MQPSSNGQRAHPLRKTTPPTSSSTKQMIGDALRSASSTGMGAMSGTSEVRKN